MNPLIQEAVLIGLAKRMAAQGSWAGETHLQKATYLLSELRDVDFDFDFILYKHGPFSFQLRDELAKMQSEGLLTTQSPNPRYGGQLRVTGRGENLDQMLSKMTERYNDSLDWIAKTLGRRGVMDLERLATAMWMTRQCDIGPHQRALELVRVKPHIELSDAEDAVAEIDKLLATTV